MGIKTAQQYLERVKKLSPRAYMNGKKIGNLLENPITKSMIDCTVRSFELTSDHRYKDIMTAQSHLSSETINRAVHINQSIEDLYKRIQLTMLVGHETGNCYYRCGASGVLNGLASTTWEMDNKLGTDYGKKFNEYLKFVQENDLVISVGVNSPKGIRTKGPLEQEDPDLSLRVVDKNPKGIVVRGAKFHQTGAVTADEHIMSPGIGLGKGEEAYALSFAVPNGEKGITYIHQYNPLSVERENADDINLLGNPRYGYRETAMVIFDDVFVPWERVFLCGEVEYTGILRARQSTIHSLFESACKASWLDLMIGATQLSAEYSGLETAPNIQINIANMIKAREICHALSVAALHLGKEWPIGSGVFFPDETTAKVGMVYTSYGFWEAIEKASDVAGGLVVTMPSEKELQNPDTSEYVKKYVKAVGPAEKRLRITKFLQNWVCGLHGAATWIGGGVPNTALLRVYSLTDLEEKKKLAAKLAGIKDR